MVIEPIDKTHRIDRRAKMITLHDVATILSQELKLRDGLNSLGNDAKI